MTFLSASYVRRITDVRNDGPLGEFPVQVHPWIETDSKCTNNIGRYM